MSKGYVTYKPEGRLGNALYQSAAAMAYAWDHNMEFSMPTTSRDQFWCPTYLPHLAKPDFDTARPVVLVKEKGFQHQELPWDEKWLGNEKYSPNIELVGFFQSVKYCQHHRERIIEAFGFPWMEMRASWCAIHIRRGDAMRYPEKHLIQSVEWIEEQMTKFPGHQFRFFSDSMDWCFDNFSHREDCHFTMPHWVSDHCSDSRREVWDLADASCCQNLIGSSSTFAAWIYFLNRNPNKHAIFPKVWLKNGWEGTTEETWKDVLPKEVERA